MPRALYLLTVALVLVAAACGDDDDADPTATQSPTTAPATATTEPAPTETPTQQPESCPLPAAACEQVFEIQSWLAVGDVESIVEATQRREYECPAEDDTPGAGGPYPLCEDAPAGEVRTGVGLARRYSEGFVLSLESYGELLQSHLDAADPAAEDDFGSGALQLVAVSCVNPDEPPEECSHSTAIFSAIYERSPGAGGGEGRELLIFWLPTDDAGSETPIETVWSGIILEGEGEIIFETGGTLPDLGRVLPMPDGSP